MRYLRDVESKQYMSSTNPTMNNVHDSYLGRRFDYMKNLQEKVIRKEFELRDKGVRFETLCDKCQNTKKLLQDTVEHSVWNGIPINIHQQQEISCTCTNNS